MVLHGLQLTKPMNNRIIIGFLTAWKVGVPNAGIVQESAVDISALALPSHLAVCSSINSFFGCISVSVVISTLHLGNFSSSISIMVVQNLFRVVFLFK